MRRVKFYTVLVNIAHSVGSSFLSLDDLTLDEIALLSSETPGDKAEETCQRLRLKQHFSPPTDELVLTALDLASGPRSDLPQRLYDASMALGHEPSENAIVPAADFKDPIATAKELEKHKYIEFDSTIEITEEGHKITQSIRKTAQGSFVIRVLKTIGLPDLAKAIIEALKQS